jgi:hypothetical protein
MERHFDVLRVEHGGERDPDVVELRKALYLGDRAGDSRGLWSSEPRLPGFFAPLSPEMFLDSHWGRSAYHARPDAPERFSTLYSFDAFREAVSRNGIPPAQMKVMSPKQGEIPVSRFFDRFGPPGIVDPDKLIRAVHLERCSIVVDNLELLDPAVSRLARDLAEWSGHAIQVNAYFTPKGSQAFKWHWDNHDVVILQVDGAKDWSVFQPRVQQPLPSHRYTMWPETGSDESERCVGSTLRKGELLYIPAAFPHYAVATESEDSLHLTFGFHSVSWHELVSELLKKALLACEGDLEFRGRVGARCSASFGEAEAGKLERLVAKVLERVDPGEAARTFQAIKARLSVQGADSASALWASLASRQSIALSSTLELRREFHLERRLGYVELHLGASKHLFPEPLHGALASVLRERKLKVSELAGLRDADKPRVASYLVEIGAVTLKP